MERPIPLRPDYGETRPRLAVFSRWPAVTQRRPVTRFSRPLATPPPLPLLRQYHIIVPSRLLGWVLFPQPLCREDEPFIRNAISRDKSVHEPTVRRPAHPRRLVGVLVIGRVAAKPQAQLASAPEGSVTSGA